MEIKSYSEIAKKRWVAKKRILDVNKYVDEQSGIYILTRFENGFKYAYIGQAVNLLERLVSHLLGCKSHIDKSLKAHGLYSEKNVCGWDVSIRHFPVEELNNREKEFINFYADKGFQLRNKTSGGQDSGKFGINDNLVGGYRKGVNKGFEKAQKEVKLLFDKYLEVNIKGKPNKIKQRAIERFNAFIDGGVKDETEKS